MPAAHPRRAGFPTARLAALAMAVSLVAGSAAHAALLPPPARLAMTFDRAGWAEATTAHRQVPLMTGGRPITFEEHAHG